MSIILRKSWNSISCTDILYNLIKKDVNIVSWVLFFPSESSFLFFLGEKMLSQVNQSFLSRHLQGIPTTPFSLFFSPEIMRSRFTFKCFTLFRESCLHLSMGFCTHSNFRIIYFLLKFRYIIDLFVTHCCSFNCCTHIISVGLIILLFFCI